MNLETRDANVTIDIINNYKILQRAKDCAIRIYKEKAIDYNNPDVFNIQCMVAAFVKIVNSEGYKVTIEGNGEKWEYS